MTDQWQNRLENEGEKLLLIPGPTPVHREILTALAEPTIAHTSSVLAEIIHECLEALGRVAGSREGQVFVFSGSGTLAQEAAVVNLVAPGERLLVASNGYFSDRFGAIAEAHGIVVDRIAVPWGTSVTADQLDEQLRGQPVRAVTITQVDTSTGVLAPVEELAEVANRHGALVIVDAVCALGGIPVGMDDNKIDVVLSGAQKALGVPPGLAILAVSSRAMERRRTLNRVSTYYADLLNWDASMSDPRIYFSTHAVNLFYALRAAIGIVEEEGPITRFARHKRLAAGFRAGMEVLGFHSLTDRAYLAPTLSVLAYPEQIEDEPFRVALAKRGVVAAGCLGSFKGRGVRFGHMGNIADEEIERAIEAVEATLRDLDVAPAVSGREVARQVMAREVATP